MMNVDNIKGIIVPIITPIDQEENIDEAKLRFMVDHVIEDGVHGILAFGSNGEFYAFDDNELQQAFEIMIEQVKGQVPVYYGIGAIRTKHAIRQAKMAEALGADGISILQPMFLKPNFDELYDHFKAVADAVPNTAVLLYNNPGRAGYNISADLVEKLGRDVDNIVGIKDSSGDFTLLSELVRRTRDFDFKVMAGKDTLVFPGLCIGTVGSVCSTANMFGPLVTSIYNKYMEGDLAGALEAQFTLDPVRLAQDKATFPVATKDMANLMGLEVGECVKPVQSSKGQVLETLKKSMVKARFIND
ncbi:dihydrodipicolinate synthase family protein [Neobacillus cucumis]|uniref:dihydrodipicolinate synthase family protein n=1 Tax=Neobacillus cucumis TaxID=1740721 RepID=UPI0028532318|nr:dihydrodipicolinate synthase family protein [Neobacillus cucumis]MDR4947267.1 dihydrodipicolinate synthase family protein [Neobacillus cucumis]